MDIILNYVLLSKNSKKLKKEVILYYLIFNRLVSVYNKNKYSKDYFLKTNLCSIIDNDKLIKSVLPPFTKNVSEISLSYYVKYLGTSTIIKSFNKELSKKTLQYYKGFWKFKTLNIKGVQLKNAIQNKIDSFNFDKKLTLDEISFLRENLLLFDKVDLIKNQETIDKYINVISLKELFDLLEVVDGLKKEKQKVYINKDVNIHGV